MATGAPGQARRVAVYLSAHGFGHAIRAAAVLDELARIVPLRLCVMAACPRSVWPDSLRSVTQWHDEPCDAGVVQPSDVTVDLAGTARALESWLGSLPDIFGRERRRLAEGFDLVVGDVPAPAFEAARAAGIPGVAVANFTWDWIYEALGFRAAADACADAYSKATLLLEAAPFAPMRAFPSREHVGLVARRASRDRPGARRLFDIDEGQSAVLVAFQPGYAGALELPPPRAYRVYLVPDGWPLPAGRPDVRAVAGQAGFSDALAAADVIVGKPGYGLIGDVEVSGARFLYVPRPAFPENEVLEAHLRKRAATVAVTADRLRSRHWEDDLVGLERCGRPEPATTEGTSRAARAIARLLGVDSERRHV